MTELAYMTREDWAQHGMAMVSQSAVIRDWLGSAPYFFAVTDARNFNHGEVCADVESVEYIAPDESERGVFDTSELARLGREGKFVGHAVVVVYPSEPRELDMVRRAVEAGSIAKLFVLIWSRDDMILAWIEGLGALNLDTHQFAPVSDPLLIAAAELIKNEEYNGLSSGRGKDVIVQLVRAFAAAGYEVEPDLWLRAYFAVGGSFRHAKSLDKLVKGIKAGKRHHVKWRYRENIVETLREQLAEVTDGTDD